MKAHAPKPYRVFVTRHYIAVKFFDVVAVSPRRAAQMAGKAARKLYPDERANATDNGWIPDDACLLERGLGSYSGGVYDQIEVAPDVYQCAPDVYGDIPSRTDFMASTG